MTVPRICLITSTPPNHKGVGAIFLRDLCKTYPDKMLSVIALCSDQYIPASVSSNSSPVLHLPPPKSIMSDAKLNILGNVRHLEFLRMYRGTHIKQTARIILKYIRDSSIDKLWIVLNSTFSIMLAAELTKKVSIPILVNVWDPISSNSNWESLDVHSRRSILTAFDQVLYAAEICGVASNTMGAHYSSIYHINTVTLIHGLPKSLWHNDIVTPPDINRVRIGFAGTIYAKKEWTTLLKVLQASNGKFSLSVLTKSFYAYVDNPLYIEYFGWRSLEDTVKILSECDVLYLPYWFSDARKESVKLCFPNKLSTYLAAGKPVLYHGPSDSTPSEFLRKYQVGVECNVSGDVDKLTTSFKRLLNNKHLYLNYSHERHKALENELGQDVFYKNFAKFIKIPFELLST